MEADKLPGWTNFKPLWFEPGAEGLPSLRVVFRLFFSVPTADRVDKLEDQLRFHTFHTLILTNTFYLHQGAHGPNNKTKAQPSQPNVNLFPFKN